MLDDERVAVDANQNVRCRAGVPIRLRARAEPFVRRQLCEVCLREGAFLGLGSTALFQQAWLQVSPGVAHVCDWLAAAMLLQQSSACELMP